MKEVIRNKVVENNSVDLVGSVDVTLSGGMTLLILMDALLLHMCGSETRQQRPVVIQGNVIVALYSSLAK